MTNHLIWVLVTDGAHARTFQKDNYASPLYPLENLSHSHDLTSQHGSDKPGRTFESGSPIRHAYEPKTDWHDHQKEIFAHELVDLFIREHGGKKFKKAYVICPAKILGILRPALTAYIQKLPQADKVTITEIIKDLTHNPLEHIQEVIASL